MSGGAVRSFQVAGLFVLEREVGTFAGESGC